MHRYVKGQSGNGCFVLQGENLLLLAVCCGLYDYLCLYFQAAIR